LDEINKNLKTRVVLSDSFQNGKKKWFRNRLILIGEKGAGKSSLFKALIGLFYSFFQTKN